ncbi:KIN14B-interacting protein At4g14310-like [Humulus lupulus]|uniref:KIN14B-interacting protein At4g14310-like n=1 Tax=Humulus lupulus TaxID=3486 RepID=UPI002B416DCE|nr:KIN14B-interacting protein At4g14310-like [Humulus lupulus]
MECSEYDNVNSAMEKNGYNEMNPHVGSWVDKDSVCQVFCPHTYLSKNMYNTITVTREGQSYDLDPDYLTISSNGFSEPTAYTSWDYGDGKFRSCYIHEESHTERRRSSKKYHAHVPYGHLLLYGNNERKEMELFDFRDMEICLMFDARRPLEPFRSMSTPIRWTSNRRAILYVGSDLQQWDFGGNTATKLNTIPFSGELKGLCTIAESREPIGAYSSRITMEGVYAIYYTKYKIYLFDARSPSTTSINLPPGITDIYSSALYEKSILLGARASSDTRFFTYRDKIIDIDIRKASSMTSYILPGFTDEKKHDTRIIQVWSNSDQVLALNTRGLFVFTHCNNPQPTTIAGIELPNIRHTKRIGPWDLMEPKFTASGKNVIITSASNCPFISNFV